MKTEKEIEEQIERINKLKDRRKKWDDDKKREKNFLNKKEEIIEDKDFIWFFKNDSKK